MRIRLDGSACAGHALCNAVDDTLFPLNDEGYCATQPQDVEPRLQGRARLGAQSCPERAIIVDEDASE